MRRIPVLTSIAVLIFTLAVSGMTHRDLPVERATLFDLPMKRIQQLRLQQVLLASVAQKRLDIAEQVAEQMTQLNPDEPTVWYNLACLQAVAGKTQPALKNLTTAVQQGFRDVRHIETDADLQSLRSEAAFAEILKAAKVPFVPKAARIFQPGRIEDGVAMVTEENTRWDNDRMSLITSFEPLSAAETRGRIVGKSAAEVAVNGWLNEGTAAGHYGDLYDNRDRDHSNLNLAKFPQLVRVEYSAGASKADADWSIRVGQAFEQPTFGNSSTAQVGSPFWRSNPRLVMHDHLLMMLVYNQFVNNQMYCYPEHNDFDRAHGDVYPANTPFWIISQGSSGSDRPFLEAIALTLAAFRPEVKRKLIEKQILMSTVQLLLRRSQKSVQTEDDYFSGKAHPVVFRSSELDPLRMVTMAHDLTLTSLPPVVRLKVVREDSGIPGRDYFHPGPAERLFDTPAAVARVYRSTAFQRRMLIDAGESVDVNGHPLTFRWSVLQGDPNRVHIRSLNKQSSQAEVTIEWHERTSIPGREGMQTNRVDIGVFAISETASSLPGFVSSFTLANEKRIYNDQKLIESVDYGDPEISRLYVDPVIDLSKNWRDDYHYDAEQVLLGWTRTFPDQEPQEFAADGRLIVRKDEGGMPVEWREVRYEELSQNGQPSRLRQVVMDMSPAISK